MTKRGTYKKRRGGQGTSFVDTATQYGVKAKESISSAVSGLTSWFGNLGKPSSNASTSNSYSSSQDFFSPTTAPAPAPTGGRRRRRSKTRKMKKH